MRQTALFEYEELGTKSEVMVTLNQHDNDDLTITFTFHNVGVGDIFDPEVKGTLERMIEAFYTDH